MTKTQKMVMASMITGMILLLGLTSLGYPYIPPFKLTIVHVPAAVGAMILGPYYGLFFGLMFGLTSLYQAIVFPTPISYMFLNPLVSILPRMLVPVLAWGVYKLVLRVSREKYSLSGLCGGLAAALSNTVLVLGMVFVLYAEGYAQAMGIAPGAVFGALCAVAGTNGLAEAALCAVIAGACMLALKKYAKVA